MKCHRYALLLICIGICSSLYCAAQTAMTSLHGVVIDPSGAVIPGAKVSIVETQTGFKADRVANDRGEYGFEQIPPGHYTIEAQASGFSGEKLNTELLVNQPRTIPFKMIVASGADTVEVDSTTEALMNTTDATMGTPFNNEQIQALPFEGNNVLDLLSLQAGVLFLGDGNKQDSDKIGRAHV